MNEYTISAIIPVYNCAGTIDVVLKKLFAAELPKLEVIIVDDASTDDTADVCRKYPVNLLPQSANRGPAVCRNLGIRNSTGSVLLFLDSDIDFEPALLRRMADFLAEHDDFAGVATLTSPEPLNRGFAPRYFALQEYLRFAALIDGGMEYWSFITTRCGLLKRDVFDETGGFNESFALAAYEDLEFSSRMDNRHKFSLDKSFLVRHYWPDTVWKILRRLYINARGVSQFPASMRRKASEPFYRDRNARLCLLLFLPPAACGPFWPVLWLPAGLLYGMALWQARWLIQGCLKHEGGLFTIKAWALYNLTLVPFVTGAVSGILGLLYGRNQESDVNERH